ncbi:MAG TPA: hypothetical protein VE546_17405 [Streptomyces sp.]|uniref:hypothetical protein n=1 Tax=Streptomyces sp. TaxID=1931 RepID=UPI002D4BD248|nr:hypothetical protein [Streptomyces sp.]HZG05319.1 hypothetical protein [Streptomyces sp.]
MVDDAGDGLLDQGETDFLRQDGELFDSVEFALVGGAAQIEAAWGRAAEAGPSVTFSR